MSVYSFTVYPGKVLSDRPISSLIYGNFLELGFGRQGDGMWAQMLFNRSFEQIPPYAIWNWLRCGPDGYNSRADWWHSGYEEQPWFKFGPDGRSEIRIRAHAGFYHGRSAGMVSHQDAGPWGLGQDGLWLRKGAEYRFRGFLACRSFSRFGDEKRKVTVKLVAEKDETHIIDRAEFEIGTQFTECKATLQNRGYTGRADLRIEARWPGSLLADGFELYPLDAVKGWRRDVLDALLRVRPTVLRFPGGCFASFYDWRDGVGPRDDRLPLASEFWGGLENNDIGTDEYLDLCEEIRCEPFLVVNVLTGTPQLAADWAEYCNGPPDSPMGKRRAANGHTQPRKVTYWELDNEPYRKFGPKQYAHRAVEFARAMKEVDPTIKLAIAGYGPFREKLGRMLDICGQYIDLVSDRLIGRGAEEDTDREIAILSAYQEKTGRRIGLCNTEWLAPFDPPTGSTLSLPIFAQRPGRDGDASSWSLEETRQYRQQRWFYALNAAVVLQRFWRRARWLDFANFNNLVNTWGQNVVEASKSAAWISVVGRVFEFFAGSQATWPVRVSPTEHQNQIFAAAARSKAKDRLIINLVNVGQEGPIQISLHEPDEAWAAKSTRGIAAPSLLSRNTEAEQNCVKTIAPQIETTKESLIIHLPSYSICEVMLVTR